MGEGGTGVDMDSRVKREGDNWVGRAVAGRRDGGRRACPIVMRGLDPRISGQVAGVNVRALIEKPASSAGMTGESSTTRRRRRYGLGFPLCL